MYITGDPEGIPYSVFTEKLPHSPIGGDYAGKELRTNPVRTAAVFDSGKVTDLHAIIPTKLMSGSDIISLSEEEKAVLKLISIRLLCAVTEDFRYAETSVVLDCGGEEFSSIELIKLTGCKLCQFSLISAVVVIVHVVVNNDLDLQGLSEGCHLLADVILPCPLLWAQYKSKCDF